MKHSALTKIPLLVLWLSSLWVATASAHPGPAGHTHPDDWPFGLIASLAILMIAMFAVRRLAKHS